ncbi:hypothetical protein [Acinetobacter sp.]|uniref:hypothetical protein n=1 Tax=Acinetobacter sp. TaxID=472 RepID=UPI00375137DB
MKVAIQVQADDRFHNINFFQAHEAIITGKQQDGHWECDMTDPGPHIGMQKFRRSTQIFLTREDAQKELDDLINYINYRMSGHKMK